MAHTTCWRYILEKLNNETTADLAFRLLNHSPPLHVGHGSRLRFVQEVRYNIRNNFVFPFTLQIAEGHHYNLKTCTTALLYSYNVVSVAIRFYVVK